jgi:hypothetical protein
MAETATLRIRDWAAVTKLASVVALLAGGVWSVWLYHQTAKQQATAARMEAQKPFASKRLEVYDRMVGLTAVIAQTDLPAQMRRSKRQELERVVNGPLALVAQDKIFAALKEFYLCLDDQRCKKGSLGLYSRNVARACRTSLEESWGVSLPPVPTSDQLP